MKPVWWITAHTAYEPVITPDAACERSRTRWHREPEHGYTKARITRVRKCTKAQSVQAPVHPVIGGYRQSSSLQSHQHRGPNFETQEDVTGEYKESSAH